MNKLRNLVFVVLFALGCLGAYPTTTEHHKIYPHTSIMASPYSGDPTGVVNCSAALEQLKANQSNTGTIHIPKGTFKIGTNLTIPAGMTLEFAAGAYFNIAAGVTLTLQGSVVAPDGQASFIGSGVLSLGTTFPSTATTKILQPGTWSVTTNTTIPSNVVLRPRNGAVLTVATGVTLTINGPVEADLYQIFSCTGTGKVVLPASVQKVPDWWGAVGNGVADDAVPLQAWATCGGNLWVPKKTYNTSAAITVPDNAVVDGQGIIKQTLDTVEGLIVKDDVTVRNITLTGAAVAYGGPNYHVGIIPYSFRNGSGNNPTTGALALYASGNRMKIDNVKFTGWDVAVWLGLDSIVQNCKATNNWREAFYAGGTGCRILHNEIDGCDSWAIDFNGGDSIASYNNIKNCGRVLADGGAIVFAGMTSEKPMTKITAIGNTIDDCNVGYGIVVLSKAADGVWGDISITNNYINGNDSAVAVCGVYLYVGAASTVTCKNVQVKDNIITNFNRMIQGVYLEGGVIQGNIGKTIAPPTYGALMLGAISKMVIDGNAILDVNGAGNVALTIDATFNNCQITNNVGEGANVGFWLNLGTTGTGNIISNNNFVGCTTAIFLQAALAAGNRIENNIGYNPVIPATPAVPPSSPDPACEYRNIFGYPIMICFTGGGAPVTAISKGSTSGALVATGLTVNAATTHATVILAPDEYISWTGAGAAPTWVFFGL